MNIPQTDAENGGSRDGAYSDLQVAKFQRGTLRLLKNKIATSVNDEIERPASNPSGPCIQQFNVAVRLMLKGREDGPHIWIPAFEEGIDDVLRPPAAAIVTFQTNEAKLRSPKRLRRCSSLGGPIPNMARGPISCARFPQSDAVVKSVGPKNYCA